MADWGTEWENFLGFFTDLYNRQVGSFGNMDIYVYHVVWGVLVLAIIFVAIKAWRKR